MAAAGNNPANLLRWVGVLRGDGVGLAGPDLAKCLAGFPDAWRSIANEQLAAEAPLRVRWLQQELGLGAAEARQVVIERPMLFVLPLKGQLQAVVAWLRQEVGLSRAQAAKAVKQHPGMLTMSIEGSLRPKLQWLLQETGIKAVKVASAICRSPVVLGLSIEDSLRPRLQWLRQEAGLNKQQAGTALGRLPELLALSIEDTLRPRLQWLHAQGIVGARAASFITAAPQVLYRTIPSLEAKLTAMRAALQASREEVLQAWCKMPTLVNLDVTSTAMAPKLRFLTQVMGRPLREVLVCPVFLGCSLTSCIGPRYSITLLHGGQERAHRLSLSALFKRSDVEFLHNLESHCRGGSLAEAVAASGCGTVQQLYAAYK